MKHIRDYVRFFMDFNTILVHQSPTFFGFSDVKDAFVAVQVCRGGQSVNASKPKYMVGNFGFMGGLVNRWCAGG